MNAHIVCKCNARPCSNLSASIIYNIVLSSFTIPAASLIFVNNFALLISWSHAALSSIHCTSSRDSESGSDVVICVLQDAL